MTRLFSASHRKHDVEVKGCSRERFDTDEASVKFWQENECRSSLLALLRRPEKLTVDKQSNYRRHDAKVTLKFQQFVANYTV